MGGEGVVTHQARKRKLPDEELGGPLLLSDLSERDRARPARRPRAAAHGEGLTRRAASLGPWWRAGWARLKRCGLRAAAAALSGAGADFLAARGNRRLSARLREAAECVRAETDAGEGLVSGSKDALPTTAGEPPLR